MNLERLKDFATPYYTDKDMMHDLWHIELVYKSVLHLIRLGNYDVDLETLTAATYFHGFIETAESDIRTWLINEGFSKSFVEDAVLVALHSHVNATPLSLEGKILHDAHLIEGGKAYMITKCLITGSLRGQSLPETISFVEKSILGKRICYLPESISLLEEATVFARQYLNELKQGIELHVSQYVF